MGMTHTTLETQPFPPPSSTTPPAPPPAPSYHSTSSSSQLSVRTPAPAPASLSPVLEEAAGFSSPGYEYEAAVTLPLQHPYSDGESPNTYPPFHHHDHITCPPELSGWQPPALPGIWQHRQTLDFVCKQKAAKLHTLDKLKRKE